MIPSVTIEPIATTAAGRRILAAASELYYLHGVSRVGVDLVAERAGTTKKTIYDRFGSKEGLVVAYLCQRAARWQRHVIDHLETSRRTGPERPLAQLDALGTWLEHTGSTGRGCAFVNAFAELAGSSDRALATIRAEKQWVRSTYAALAAEAGHPTPEPLGRRLALLHEGAIAAAGAGGSATALADARAAMRQLLAVVAEPAAS